MPGAFSDSWRLTKTSFRLIHQDPALLIFPLVAGLSALAVLVLFFLGTYFLAPVVFPASGVTGYQIMGVVLFLIAYFAMTIITVYTTGALVGAATLKLNGRQPTAADGWRIARENRGRLIVWALIAATVGLVIQIVSARFRGIAGLLIRLVGEATWAVVTYFMIPVLIYERTPVWRSLTRSARLFIGSFGRTIVSNFVLGLIVALGIVAAVGLGVAGFYFLVGGSRILGFGLLAGALGIGVLVALIAATAEGILRAALYRYATTGKVEPDLIPPTYLAARGEALPSETSG